MKWSQLAEFYKIFYKSCNIEISEEGTEKDSLFERSY